jgi:hypothetical protein
MVGATVEGEGPLREVVALPGSVVRAPLHRAIVLPGERVLSIAD